MPRGRAHAPGGERIARPSVTAHAFRGARWDLAAIATRDAGTRDATVRGMDALPAHAERGDRGVLRALLACGILSSSLYVVVDVVLSATSDTYRYADQMVSELSAIGAPTRPWWLVMTALYVPLLMAFGWGVRAAAGSRRGLRAAGWVLVVTGVVGGAWAFFPMHMRGSETTLTDTMHIAFTIVNGLFTVSMTIAAAVALGRAFRVYSIATVVVQLVAGIATSFAAPGIEAGLPTPWMGLMERISVYGYLLWVVVLAVVSLHEPVTADRGVITGPCSRTLRSSLVRARS